MSNVEDFIEQNKSEVVAEAELARDDLQEIEDHLRTLTAELRESGLSSEDAVRMACERLGDPRAVAREHAKVSSPFGARLSWARTISAGALLLAGVSLGDVFVWMNWDRVTISPLGWGTQILSILMVAALLARLTWARAVAFGAVGFYFVSNVLGPHRHDVWMMMSLILLAGPVLFVAPWRRNELRRAGYAVALQAFAFASMVFAAQTLGLDAEVLAYAREHMLESVPGGLIHMAPAALLGCLPAFIAIVGTIVRARWAGLASAFGALMLSASIIEVVRYQIGFHQIEYTGDWLPLAAMLLSGSIASAVAAAIGWRSGRSSTGTLRYVLH